MGGMTTAQVSDAPQAGESDLDEEMVLIRDLDRSGVTQINDEIAGSNV
jgi:hypothetical protein